VLGRRRRPRTQRLAEPRQRAALREGDRRRDHRRRRPRRRLYGEGRRRVRHRPDREGGEHHAARRGVSGRGVASARLASRAQDVRDEVGNGALKRAVFLDRDGVVNDAVVRDGRPHPPPPEQLRIAADAPEALKALHDGGFELIVVTSQPDVARGTASLDALHAIERRLRDALPLDAFYVCPHDDADRCACRKPLPGLIETAACERGIDLGGSFLIGDRWRDVAAAQAAGVTSIFLDRGYAEPRPEPPADATFGSLREAARWIVNGAAVEGVLGEAPIPDLARLRTRVFADGADLAQIVALAADPRIAGFTTNPTLMRKAGVRDYAAFARAVLEVVGERPISFEVFADDEPEMERQARAIACWGANVYVKIPVTDTTGVSTMPLVRRLSAGGVRLNVTA